MHLFAFVFTQQFVLFLVFGGFAALVNIGVGVLLYDVYAVGIPYPVSVCIAAFCGLLVNFFCNYIFNFTQHSRKTIHHFRSFFVVSVIGTLLTSLISSVCLVVLLPVVGKSFYIATYSVSSKFCAHFMAVGIVVFYSYFAHKYISFGDGFRVFLKKRFSARTISRH